MQSKRARVLVALGSVAAIVVLFVVFAAGDDDGDQSGDGVANPTTTKTTTTGDSGSNASGKPVKSPKPQFEQITIVGGQPEGGVQDLNYSKGDEIRIEVSSDAAEEVHIHGYDLSQDVAAGGKVRFKFAADIDGVFGVELEQSAVPIAELTVRP